MRHRVAQVVKDKDVPLRNATITDDILPEGRKVVHINCVAHAHMHLDKSAAGNLEVREALGWCMSCLKNIDESNKVCVLWWCIACFMEPMLHLHVVSSPCVLILVHCSPYLQAVHSDSP
jgi:hypothetical protein